MKRNDVRYLLQPEEMRVSFVVYQILLMVEHSTKID